MSQNVIERFVQIPQGGTVNAGLQTLGRYPDCNGFRGFELRKLRVAPVQPYAEKFTAMVSVPGNILIGPIDIPFTLNVELPVGVAVSCLTPCSNNQTIELIVSDLPDSPNLYGATYFVNPRQNVDVAIPDAVVAVTPYPSTAVLTFRDSAAAVIATATGPLMVARPRTAKTVSSNSATPGMLFHY
jgi:hypothetical protein